MAPGYLARLLPLLLLAITAASCDQYQRFGQSSSDSLGPVDPVTFPPANLGTRGDRMKAGSGTFTQIKAWSADGEVPNAPYFAYPVPAAMLMADPLAAKGLGAAPAYVFDASKCPAPAGYDWTKRLRDDEMPLDQQGNVFTALPKATYTAGVAATSSYVPVVQQVPASATGRPCQALKSEEMLKGAGLKPKADGKLLAFLIIDPAAAVNPGVGGFDGFGLQRWGWYNRYIVAYLDGGELPLSDDLTKVVPQRLYYPRSMVVRKGPDGMPLAAAGRIGAGYDVLQAQRGQPGYSPICQVFTYDLGMTPAAPKDEVLPTDFMGPRLPTSAAAIEMMFGTVEMPVDPMRPLRPATPPFIYCLQVAPTP